MPGIGRDLSIGNEFKRIACSGIFSEVNIREVDIFSLLFEGDVLQNCAKLNRVVDLWLFLLTQVHTFCIAPTFDIKYSLISPHMFIIPNQSTIPNSTQRSLACS